MQYKNSYAKRDVFLPRGNFMWLGIPRVEVNIWGAHGGPLCKGVCVRSKLKQNGCFWLLFWCVFFHGRCLFFGACFCLSMHEIDQERSEQILIKRWREHNPVHIGRSLVVDEVQDIRSAFVCDVWHHGTTFQTGIRSLNPNWMHPRSHKKDRFCRWFHQTYAKPWCIFHSWPKGNHQHHSNHQNLLLFSLFPFKKEIKQTTKINQEKPVCVAFHFFASVASAQGFSCSPRVSLERQPRRSFGALLRRSVQRRLVATLCFGWKLGWASWRWNGWCRWFVVCLVRWVIWFVLVGSLDLFCLLV